VPRPDTAERLTERLVLRAPGPADRERVAAILCDPATHRHNPAGTPTAEQAAEMLAGWIAHWREHGFGYWLVATRAAPEAILGVGGIRRRMLRGADVLNLYVRFSPAAWGHGYASETAAAALRLAFEELGADRVMATVRASNLPSRRVLERAGMSDIGELPDPDGHESSRVYAVGAPAPTPR
jgi:RimJ/RimL family protein N-acetyltransferase